MAERNEPTVVDQPGDTFLDHHQDFQSRENMTQNSVTHYKVRYKLLRAVYKSQGITSARPQLLNRMARQKPEFIRVCREKYYICLTEYANLLLMSETEISLWAIYLEQLKDIGMDLSLKVQLILTAYTAKAYFGKHLSMYEYILTKRFPKFSLYYRNWLCIAPIVFEVSEEAIESKMRSLKEKLTCPKPKKEYYDILVDQLFDDHKESPREDAGDNSTTHFDLKQEQFEKNLEDDIEDINVEDYL